MSKTRLCLILPSYWEPVMGGAQYQAKVLVERMEESADFDIHYLARRLPDDLKPAGHSLHRIGTSKGMYFAKDARRLLNTLKQINPDTIYVHVGSAYVGIAAWYCRTHNAKLVWHFASDIDVEPWHPRQRRNPVFSFVDKKLMEYGLRKADALIAQSVHQDELLQKNYNRRASAIIKNFHPRPTEALIKSQPPTVLWVANLKKVKQPLEFIRLAQALAETDAQFYMMGGMQLEEADKFEVQAALEATPNVTWLGSVSQTAVNEHMAKATLLVNTSVYEGFSNTFIQAWQRAVPVCSLSVNPDKLLTDGGLGTCADGNFEKLTQQVKHLLDNAPERDGIGKMAGAYAEQNHGLTMADKLIEILR